MFIVNPVSGGITKDAFLEHIGSGNGNAAYRQKILKTTGEGDEKSIKQAIDAFRPDLVVIAGGDGTVHLVAGIVIPLEIPVAIIPMGSANGLARELDIPGNFRGAMELIEKPLLTRELDVMHINGELCIHICDLGLNATVVKRFERSGFRGILGYFVQYVKEIRKSHTYAFLLKTGGKTIRVRALMLILTNMRKLGTGAIINPAGDPEDGQFELCIVKKFPYWMIFRIVLSLFSGNIDSLRYFKIRSYAELELENPSGAPFQIDGEPQEEIRKVRVKNSDKKLRVVVPRS